MDPSLGSQSLLESRSRDQSNFTESSSSNLLSDLVHPYFCKNSHFENLNRLNIEPSLIPSLRA